MDDDCPAAVDDIDSDWEDYGPPPLTDSESDGSDHEKEQLPAGKTTDDIEREFAVPQDSTQSGRRKYTCKKRVRKALVAARRDTSTQAGKAATEAAKYGVRNCIYLESDSMDQAKTQIPRTAEESKMNAELEKLQLHVTIVRIFNGDEDHIFTYVWPAYLSGGSDASITFILDALGRVHIPPSVTKLYAFTDNASGEYKNRIVMALWHCLVQHGLFLKIKHAFLGFGHTHYWIVDGIFKHMAQILLRNKCPVSCSVS